MAIIKSLYRYPVKGLSAQELQNIKLKTGEGFSFDRFWALENGAHDFDETNPRFLPKRRFLQLAQTPQLAQLNCRFDEDKNTLTIVHQGREIISGEMTCASDINAIEKSVERFMQNLTGSLRLVSAPGHHFSDIPQKAVSLINLASVEAISKAAGKKVSPLRFRGNIYLSGLKPWEELEWEGKSIAINGKPLLDVFAITGRCPATKVNLETGERDIPMLDILSDNFGHTNCGVYATVTSDAIINANDTLEVF